MFAPESIARGPALAPQSLLICVDAATCSAQLAKLLLALERGGCAPSVWRLDEMPRAPDGISPVLTLVGAASHATSELRVVQIVHHLRHHFDVPVLELPSLVDEEARIAPWRNPFDGVLPDITNAQFFTQLHLWLRLQNAEARVQTAERRLRLQVRAHEQLFAHLPFGVLVAENPGGGIVYQNAAAAQICGMAMPDIGDYDSYAQFSAVNIDNTPLPALHYPMVRSLASGEVIVDEMMRWRRGNGRIVELRVHSAPVRDGAGAITGALCLFRDITEQLQTAAMRQKTALHLEQIANASPAHAVVVDRAGCYIFVNRTHRQWCERSETELVGLPLAATLTRSHYSLVQCAFNEALSGQHVAIEHVLTGPDNQGRHFFMQWTPMREGDAPEANIIGAIGYFVDIDALRQTEIQVAQREMRFTFMSECLPIKVFTTDKQGGINYVNSTWYDYIGRMCNGSLGHGWMTSVHEDDLPRIMASQNEYARATGAVSIEYRLRRHDGVYRWHRAKCLPLPAVGEDPLEREWVGVCVDIEDEVIARETAEKRMRESQAQSKLALAAAGEAREQVDALQQERIAREQFVATLSHDLRTPLTAARMGIERLVDALEDDTKLSRIATRVARSISRTDVMLEDFLDVSRVCAGRPLLLKRTNHSMRDIVRTSLADLDPLHAKRCKLATSDLGEGAWDAMSVRRVVENLVGNALKYGERESTITLRVADAADDVVLTVHNAGDPIAPDDQKRLFEHFDRLENATAGGERGWGIGLTLVAGIARAYQGRVEVTSDAQSGTTFRVRLPRVEASLPI